MRSGLILVLVFVISCSPKTVPPAQPTTQVVEQGNKIIMAVQGDPKENYRDIVQYFSDQGFRLHFVDVSSLNFKTAYKPVDVIEDGINSYIRINASVMDSTIHFSGQFRRVGLEEEEIKQEGTNVIHHQVWQKLVEIVEGYPHEEIYFSERT